MTHHPESYVHCHACQKFVRTGDCSEHVDKDIHRAMKIREGCEQLLETMRACSVMTDSKRSSKLVRALIDSKMEMIDALEILTVMKENLEQHQGHFAFYTKSSVLFCKGP